MAALVDQRVALREPESVACQQVVLAAALLRADAAVAESRDVRLLHKLYVPGDEMCLLLFEAPSAGDVVRTIPALEALTKIDWEAESSGNLASNAIFVRGS